MYIFYSIFIFVYSMHMLLIFKKRIFENLNLDIKMYDTDHLDWLPALNSYFLNWFPRSRRKEIKIIQFIAALYISRLLVHQSTLLVYQNDRQQ